MTLCIPASEMIGMVATAGAGDGLILALGETLALGEMLGDSLALGLMLADGETDGLSLADGDTDGLSLALGLMLGDSDALGLMLADGLTEGLALALGEMDADGLTLGLSEELGLTDGDTLAEGLDWCSVALPTGTVQRATYSASPVCTGPAGCPVERWQATTAVEVTFVPPYCEPAPVEEFGNICLTRIDGVKEVYDDGMPGQVPPKPGEGWQIALAGTDVLGRDVVPSNPECSLLPMAAEAPIDIPCLSPGWYETITDADGKFAFVDLLPGHYHLAEQPTRATG